MHESLSTVFGAPSMHGALYVCFKRVRHKRTPRQLHASLRESSPRRESQSSKGNSVLRISSPIIQRTEFGTTDVHVGHNTRQHERETKRNATMLSCEWPNSATQVKRCFENAQSRKVNSALSIFVGRHASTNEKHGDDVYHSAYRHVLPLLRLSLNVVLPPSPRAPHGSPSYVRDTKALR